MTNREPIIDGPVILTRSGLYVEPLNLKVEDVVIEDIAHSLSNQCRYTGHTEEFYSVGEHSVRCMRWLEDRDKPLPILRWALLHDASEAYLVDIPRPLKVDPYFGKAYRGAEDRAMEVICEAFGLERVSRRHGMPDVVREADMALLATERRDLMPPNGRWLILDGIEPLPDVIHPWPPRKARQVFMHEYNRLFGGAK